jgi:hypothetical protein
LALWWLTFAYSYFILEFLGNVCLQAFCNAFLNKLVHLFGDLSFHYQKHSVTQVMLIKMINKLTLFPYVVHVLAL